MSSYEAEMKRVILAESEAIKALIEDLDYEVMQEIVDLFIKLKAKNNKVITAGCGTSGQAAKKIAHSLSCVEIPAYFLSPADSVHGALGSVQKGDVVLLIAKGGNTSEITSYIAPAKAKGAIVIGVSENPESLVAKECDIYLKVKVEKEPCPWNMLATASTMAVIAAFDSIAITAMQYNGYDAQQFLLIHPGGAVGEKLAKMG